MSILKRLTTAQKWVVALIAVTLALATANFGKAIVAYRYAVRLPQLPTTVSLSYFAATGALWGLAFVLCTVGLSRFRAWGRTSTLTAITLYQVNVWINRLLFSASEYARQASLRDLLFSATVLVVYWGLLNLPAVRRTFDRSQEQG